MNNDDIILTNIHISTSTTASAHPNHMIILYDWITEEKLHKYSADGYDEICNT